MPNGRHPRAFASWYIVCSLRRTPHDSRICSSYQATTIGLRAAFSTFAWTWLMSNTPGNRPYTINRLTTWEKGRGPHETDPALWTGLSRGTRSLNLSVGFGPTNIPVTELTINVQSTRCAVIPRGSLVVSRGLMITTTNGIFTLQRCRILQPEDSFQRWQFSTRSPRTGSMCLLSSIGG